MNARAATPAEERKPPVDLGDPEQVREREKIAKRRDARVDAGLAKIMADPDTRAWLYHQIDEAGPFRATFTGNSQTFYNCGAQAWAQRMLARLLDTHLDAYVTMMKEAKNG